LLMVSVEDVRYSYPHQRERALDSVNLKVKAGESLFVTGRSGSGKSTLAAAITGIIPNITRGNFQGRVTVNGKDTRSTPIRELAAEVGYVFQNPESQFFTLTVDQEVSLGPENLGLDDVDERVEEALRMVGLEDKRHESVFNLSAGEKQRVAIASQLSMSPEVIVMDEPTANLDPQATEDFFRVLENLTGRTLILIDHRTFRVPEVFDMVAVMEEGRIIHEGCADELMDRDFRERYGLRSPERGFSFNKRKMKGRTILRTSGLSRSYGDGFRLEDINLELARGTVLGVTGPNGSGKTTLARLMAGLLKPHRGRVEVRGSVGLVMQDPDHQLFMDTVEGEITFGVEDYNPGDVEDVLRTMNLHRHIHRHPHSLSGGEKQRTLISVFLYRKPDVIIMDEPTTGMDLDNMKRLASWIERLREMGVAVMIITHDHEFLSMVADDIMVLRNGRQVNKDKGDLV